MVDKNSKYFEYAFGTYHKREDYNSMTTEEKFVGVRMRYHSYGNVAKQYYIFESVRLRKFQVQTTFTVGMVFSL